MPTSNIFPSTQTDLNDHLGVIVPYLAANAARLGVSAVNSANLNKLYSNPNVPPNTLPNTLGWKELWLLHSSHDSNTHTIVSLVSAMRTSIEKQLRSIYNDIPQSALTATDRSTLNLPVHDTHHTKIQVANYAPKGSIEENIHLMHTLRITDPQNPQTKAMPEGNKVEVQISYADSQATIAARTASPPAGGAAVGLTTSPVWIPAENSPASRFLFDVSFTDDLVGKMAVYRLRYQNNTGDKGPWSDTFSALIS